MTTTIDTPGTIATRVFDVLVGYGQSTAWNTSAMSAKGIAEAALQVAASQGVVISAIDARLIALVVGQYNDYGSKNRHGALRVIRNSIYGHCDLMAYHARLDGEQLLMNRQTGSVDTRANWLAEAPTWDVDIADDVLIQFNELLVPVVLSPDGSYVETDGTR